MPFRVQTRVTSRSAATKLALRLLEKDIAWLEENIKVQLCIETWPTLMAQVMGVGWGPMLQRDEHWETNTTERRDIDGTVERIVVTRPTGAEHWREKLEVLMERFHALQGES